MKRIYLMRHTRAGQTNKHMLNDHERPLTKKGEELMPASSEYFNIHYKDSPPQIILSSTALRAKQTAALFKKNFKLLSELEVRTYTELYITGTDEILSVIHKIDNNLNSALIISHCPGLLNFAIKFSGSGDKVKFKDMKANFVPASFAAFDIDCKDWASISENSGILLDFVNGKNLKPKKIPKKI
jgi:phosphohistidine phosphatase